VVITIGCLGRLTKVSFLLQARVKNKDLFLLIVGLMVGYNAVCNEYLEESSLNMLDTF